MDLSSAAPLEVVNPYVLEALNSAGEHIEDGTEAYSSFTSFSSWTRA
jgi:hypothetical protein